MERKEIAINEIIISMQDCLNKEQLVMLDETLRIKLHGV